MISVEFSRVSYLHGQSLARLAHILGDAPIIDDCPKSVSKPFKCGFAAYIRDKRLELPRVSFITTDPGIETMNITKPAHVVPQLKQYKTSFKARLALTLGAKQNQRKPKWWI